MVDALHTKGLPYAYLPIEGEEHDFRIAKNVERYLEADLYFYSRIFGFDPSDPLEPVPIENL
jgi:dipeptidyl aminopeptidase/acylaminoacyl peptidase